MNQSDIVLESVSQFVRPLASNLPTTLYAGRSMRMPTTESMKSAASPGLEPVRPATVRTESLMSVRTQKTFSPSISLAFVAVDRFKANQHKRRCTRRTQIPRLVRNSVARSARRGGRLPRTPFHRASNLKVCMDLH